MGYELSVVVMPIGAEDWIRIGSVRRERGGSGICEDAMCGWMRLKSERCVELSVVAMVIRVEYWTRIGSARCGWGIFGTSKEEMCCEPMVGPRCPT